MFNKQNPGHLGSGGCWKIIKINQIDQYSFSHYITGVVILCVVVATSLSPAGIQQLPSLGQNASLSMSSQNRANKPLTHSPSQSFNT